MKEETKKKLKEARTLVFYTANAMGIATFVLVKCAITYVTPGDKGKAGRNQIKLFKTGIAYKFTPFGDKEYQERLLDILDKKEDVYFNIDLINQKYKRKKYKEQREALKTPHLTEIKKLNQQEKQLKKTRK